MEDYEKNFKILIDRLQKIGDALNGRDVSDRLGRKVREIIYRRVKSGFGVTSDSEGANNVSRQKLKELSQSYKAFRRGEVIFRKGKNGKAYPISNKDGIQAVFAGSVKARGGYSRIRYKKTNAIVPPTLGPFGRPDKSNLTLSGQMLESMTVTATSQGFSVFIPDTSRRPVTQGDKARLTNKRVAELVAKDRPFMALTEGEVRILRLECEAIINEKIAQLIK